MIRFMNLRLRSTQCLSKSEFGAWDQVEAPIKAPNMAENANDADLCEYLVRVEWIKAVPKEQAYWEKGLFAIQHTACRMTSSFTIEKLTQRFGLDGYDAD
jgi:hypothetical protein